MEPTEENFSIDHFEEKLVSYSCVLERANQQEASGSATGRNEEADRTSEKATAEMESNVNKTDEVLPREKSEANILPNEEVSSQVAAKEKVEILMGVKQTIEVELIAKETDQEKNAQDMNPESAQKSELNPFIGSKETAVDQAVNMKLKGENVASGVENNMLTKVDLPAGKQQDVNMSSRSKDVKSGTENIIMTKEVGRPADKYQILNVTVGYKDVSPEKEILAKEILEDQRLTLDVSIESKDVPPGVESEMLTKEVGQLTDKPQALNVSAESKDVPLGAMTKEKTLILGQPQTSSDPLKTTVPSITTTEIGLKSSTANVGLNTKQVEVEKTNLMFKSAAERPSSSIDIEAPKATELNSKYQASTSILMKDPVVPQSIQKEEKADVESGVLQSHPIEVERKFQVTNFDEKKLLQANGKLMSELTFEDEYYDNNSYDLILMDCWLRKRNLKWEFKIPVNRDPNQLYMSTQFQELEDEEDIRKELYKLIKSEAQVTENQGIIEEFKLKPFATFTTTRKSYSLPAGCTVVIDFTSFGYSVGEIEMMVNDNSEIGEAIDRINTIAGELGKLTFSVFLMSFFNFFFFSITYDNFSNFIFF